MTMKRMIVILALLIALVAVCARAEKRREDWRIWNPCFDSAGKWFAR